MMGTPTSGGVSSSTLVPCSVLVLQHFFLGAVGSLSNHLSGRVSDVAIVVNVLASSLGSSGPLGNEIPLVYSQLVFVPNETFVGSVHSACDDTRELQKELELLGQLAVVGPVHFGEKVRGCAENGALDASDERARDNLIDGSFDLSSFVVGRNGFSGRHDRFDVVSRG
ncbi:uncharacterized protein YALI1_D06682g [Yarrowia lipolytica]|uniref:Uncharacterized protein n=1 Tax=Yarrowia lipolytica TaxID=4952 RepID=A0A1D8ND95_YARLL|nr:hypothetical protein YALI1_D06682g [Yarrowia lipolytica]